MTLDDLKIYFRDQIESINPLAKEPKLFYMERTEQPYETDNFNYKTSALIDLKRHQITIQSVRVDELETLLDCNLEYSDTPIIKGSKVIIPRFDKKIVNANSSN